MMRSLARIDGYRSAMNAAGLPIRDEWIRFGDFHLAGGLRHGSELLALHDRPTAIFAGSDVQALGGRSRRLVPWVCGCRRISLWSATTTSRSPTG